MTYDISGAVSGDCEDVTVFWGAMRRRVTRELTQTFQSHLSPSSPVEAVDSLEVSVHLYHSTRRHMAEDIIFMMLSIRKVQHRSPCCVVLLS